MARTPTPAAAPIPALAGTERPSASLVSCSAPASEVEPDCEARAPVEVDVVDLDTVDDTDLMEVDCMGDRVNFITTSFQTRVVNLPEWWA